MDHKEWVCEANVLSYGTDHVVHLYGYPHVFLGKESEKTDEEQQCPQFIMIYFLSVDLLLLVKHNRWF